MPLPLALTRERVGALNVELTPEDVKYLEEPYKPLEVFGHM